MTPHRKAILPVAVEDLTGKSKMCEGARVLEVNGIGMKST